MDHERPDDFELRTRDDRISLHFADYGPARPHLTYSDVSGPGRQFFGPQDIQRTSHPALGDILTVTLEVIADGDRCDFTLLLPASRLKEDVAAVRTVAIYTRTRGSIASPTLHGQLQEFDVEHFEGQARRRGSMAVSAIPPALFKVWVHAFEDDSGDIKAYRPADSGVGPGRRERMDIRPDRTFIRHGFGPGDEPVQHEGRWESLGDLRFRITFDDGASHVMTVVSVDDDRLRITSVDSQGSGQARSSHQEHGNG